MIYTVKKLLQNRIFLFFYFTNYQTILHTYFTVVSWVSPWVDTDTLMGAPLFHTVTSILTRIGPTWCHTLLDHIRCTEIHQLFKGGISLKIKNLHIHLYLIATKYLWNNALVEYIHNWTRSYSLIIINEIVPKNIWRVSHKMMFSTCRQFVRSKNTNVVLICLFKHKFIHYKHL